MNPAGGGGPVRCRIVYAGLVQGVCFRANTLDIARRYPVVGYVRNLPDGDVELEVEGPVGQVEAVLQAVAARFTRNIVDARRTALPVRGDETRFEIRT